MTGEQRGGGDLLIRDARIVTAPPGEGYRRGRELGQLEVWRRADILILDGVIREVGPGLVPPGFVPEVRAEGRVVLPGFVDAHTHACWAGSRIEEWGRRLGGTSYAEILGKGGGILSTVAAVRESSEVMLAAALRVRLGWLLDEGTTTVEVKSGYGLDTETELRMLRAIGRAAADWPGTVVPTACLGHALDPDQVDPVETVIHETLPAVSREFPGIAIDAYCEEGAWSLNDCLRLFDAARERGHRIRVHADQFNSLGMIPEAVRRRFDSVDHLEATTAVDLGVLARSATAGVLLPISGFHLDDRYAHGRTLVDGGGAVVVATNWNPGSAPSPSLPLAAALAVRKCGLTPTEALASITANPAVLLGEPERGRIGPGRPADLVLLRHRDERELVHTMGGSPVALVVCGGRVVAGPMAKGVGHNVT